MVITQSLRSILSVPETYELTIKAFNLAEKFRTPVILLMDEVIGHMRERIEIPDTPPVPIIDRKRPTGPKELSALDNSQGMCTPLANFGRLSLPRYRVNSRPKRFPN